MPKRVKVTNSKAIVLISLAIMLALTWAIIRMVPGAAPSLGMRGGHEFTFLRWGSMYTEVHAGAWLFGSPKRRSSLIFATKRERIVLQSRTSIERGRVMITVYSGPWVGQEIHAEQQMSSGTYQGQVFAPHTGFYRITANYVFTFRGRHDLDWRVE